MWLLCGLGNPENKYNFTRHNLGFDIVNELIENYSFKLIKKDKNIEIHKGFIDTVECLLAKPLSYMNNSDKIRKKKRLKEKLRLVAAKIQTLQNLS